MSYKVKAPKEFKQISKRLLEYREFKISKSAYQWYIQGSADVEGLRTGSYIMLGAAFQDIDNLFN